MNEIICDKCNGSRLRSESLYFKINDKDINELVDFGRDNFTQLPSTPTLTTTGVEARDVSSPTVTAANTYSAYTQANTFSSC